MAANENDNTNELASEDIEQPDADEDDDVVSPELGFFLRLPEVEPEQKLETSSFVVPRLVMAALVPYPESDEEQADAAVQQGAGAVAMQADVAPLDVGKRSATETLSAEPKRSRLPPPNFTGEITSPTFVNQAENEQDEPEEEALPTAVALMPPQVRFRKPNRVTEDREALGLRSDRRQART